MPIGRLRSTSRRRSNWGALGSGCAGLLASLDAQAQTQPTLIQGHPTASVLLGAGVACAVALALLAWQRRASAEAALWREERARVQRLLSLIDGLPDTVVWRTDAQHRLAHAQPAARGWTAGTGRPLWECFQCVANEAAADAPGTELSSPARRDGRPAATGLLQVDVEPFSSDASADNAATPPDGAPAVRWRLHALPCFDEHGLFAGHEGIARRLPAPQPATALSGAATAGREAGAATADRPVGGLELSRDAEALKQSEEAASFSYSVSHDLRAPIRVVEGFAKILKEDYGPGLDRIGNDHIDRVLGAAARMNNMIDALLALSRLGTQPLARQTVNLSQLATYVIEDLRRHTPDRRVEAIIEPGLQAVGDPILLRVALENLLGNAWKYSAQRTLATVEFKSVAQAGRKVFCVADNGAGFDMRFADRLFGVFQRLHSSSDFAGTGVGLATVRRIVHRHGGDIWAEAEVERGAKFYFTLPN